MQGEKILKILRIINIATACLVIILSALSFIFVFIAAITSLKFFLIFSPVFMTCFGFAMLAAEFKVKFVLERLPFLGTVLGRALFNIYLSSVIYYYFEASDENFLAWVGALSLFITGTVYLCIHFGWGKKLAKMINKDEKNQDEVENVENQGRQPLM